MPVTQRDVAEAAGVAQRTVSNVLNDFPHVRPEVRERVLAAMDQLGYRPNRAARTLRTGRTGVLGLVIPALDLGYFGEIGTLVIEEARDLGYAVVIAQTRSDLEGERSAIRRFVADGVDGILVDTLLIEEDELRELVEDVPIVLLGEHLAGAAFDRVSIDNSAATAAVVAHLAEGGRQRIGFLGDSARGLDLVSDRLVGYRAALARHGLPAGPVLSVSGYRRVDGFDTVSAALAEGLDLDALVAATDLLAIGALRAFADVGIEVPSQVAVVGHDDLADARYAIPRLSSVAPDKPALARAAVAMLDARIADPDVALQVAGGSEWTLSVRESSA